MTDQANTTHSHNQLVRKILLYSSVLMGVCIASAAGVSILYVTNKDRIHHNRLKSFRTTLAVVLGAAKNAHPLDKDKEMGKADVYVASTEKGVRYAARGSARGYQSVITVLVSVDAQSDDVPLSDDPTIHRAAVVSSQETPGLGENINKVKKDVSLWTAIYSFFAGQQSGDGPNRPWFQAQFTGKKLSNLEVNKTGDDGITPITGATITSKGTTQAVRNAVEALIRKTQKRYGQNDPESDSETRATGY